MNIPKSKQISFYCKHLVLLCLISSLVLYLSIAYASSHREGPPASSNDERSDLNDVYIFSNAENIVTIMCANPDVEESDPEPFRPGTSYEFKIDNNQNNTADKTFSAKINRSTDGGSSFINIFSQDTGEKKDLIGSGRVGETILLQNGGKATADIFDDPFFFDQEAYEQFQQTKDANSFNSSNASNSFAAENIAAIVMELPLEAVRPASSSSPLNIWARTVKNGNQFDRAGSPGLSMLLIPEKRKTAFARGKPKDDSRFTKDITSSLRSLGNSRAQSRTLARTLLPNVLRFNPTNPSSYPNGRNLEDDVMDSLLNSITFGRVTSDFVSCDSSFLDSFPYLGSPNTSNAGAPTAAHVAAGSANSQDVININSQNSIQVDVTFGSDSLSSTMISLTLSDGTTTIQGGTIAASSGQGVASFSSINAAGLADGPVTINVIGSTLSGNSINFNGTAATKDTVAPAQPSSVVIPASSEHPQNVINSLTQSAIAFDISLPSTYLGTETLVLEGSDGSNTFTVPLTAPAGGGIVNATGVNGSGLVDGGVTLTITATDISGNSSTRTGTATKDIVPPITPTAAHVKADLSSNLIDQITPISETAVKIDITLPAQSSSSDSVSVALSDGGSNVTAGPSSAPQGAGTLTISGINASGLSDGPITLQIISQDTVGNITQFSGTIATKN